MNLNMSYKRYLDGVYSKSRLRDITLEYAYDKAKWDKYIEQGDFILKFMIQIDEIISNYDSEKAGFYHYINQCIKWTLLDFNKEYVKEKSKQEAYLFHYKEENRGYSSLLKEEEPQYIITPKAQIVLEEISSKRLLIFILKNSRVIKNDQIEKLAPIVEKSPEWIFSKKVELFTLCEDRLKKREYLELRHNRLFIDINRDQEKLLKICNVREKKELQEQIDKKKERKRKIYNSLKKRNFGPINDDIANVLKIPKGTVDSSLFYVKKRLRSL
ncbi:MAG: hypothetical protein B6229_03005 [Spirochaetaceae bacterium 4572_7]|nr:MAG: hypothetical protein B6229_03005 [Spirochaetaceae bacterium 4572_7]